MIHRQFSIIESFLTDKGYVFFLSSTVNSPKLSSILQYSMDDRSVDDKFREWVESMGVASGRG